MAASRPISVLLEHLDPDATDVVCFRTKSLAISGSARAASAIAASESSRSGKWTAAARLVPGTRDRYEIEMAIDENELEALRQAGAKVLGEPSLGS